MTEWSWDRWNTLLADEFFPTGSHDVTLHFNVDDYSLAGLSGLEAGQTVETLCEVVRSEVGPEHRLSRVASRLAVWERSGRDAPPPVLPLLAVTVLAATRMGDRAGEDPRDYYRPYRRLLCLEGSEAGEPSGYGSHIPSFWEAVKEWANGSPLRGRCSIQRGSLPFVGYALGQAAFRRADLVHLHRFFRCYALTSDDAESDARELRAYLAQWSSAALTGPLARLHRLATLDPLIEQCESILRESLATWNPNQPDGATSGGSYGPVRFALSLQGSYMGLAPSMPPGFPDGVIWTCGDDDKFELHELEGGWFDPEALKTLDPLSVLADGVQLNHGEKVLSYLPSEVLALKADDILGFFVNCDRIEFGVTYQLLVSARVRPAVQKFIADAGITGLLDASQTHRFKNEWFVIRDFCIDAPPTAMPPEPLARILGRGGLPRRHLIGGLRLGAGRVYLKGGAPSLALPPGDERTFTIAKVGREQTETFRVPPDNGEFPLEELDLQPGQYVVALGEHSWHFAIDAGAAAVAGPGAGSVALGGAGGSATGLLATHSERRGPQPREVHLLLVPRGDREGAYLGARDDQAQRIRRPVWLKAIDGGPWWSVLDQPSEFEPVWLVEFTKEAPVLRLIRSADPERTTQPANLWNAAINTGQLRPDADVAEEVELTRYRQVAQTNGFRPIRMGRPRSSGATSSGVVSSSVGVGYDVLLHWCSEIGQGGWPSFRNAAATVQRRWNRTSKAWWIASRLSALGHLDVDWEGGRWSVAPPVIALLPGTGGCAVLAGARTTAFMKRVRDEMPNEVDIFDAVSQDGPTASYLKAREVKHLQEFAEGLGVAFVVDPGREIISLLPPSVDCLEEAAEPHFEAVLEVLNVLDGSWSRADDRLREGLYRWDHQGMRRHRLRRADAWWKSPDIGHLYAFAYRVAGGPPLKFKAQHDEQPSRLLMPLGLVLPEVAERALVACSGQLPPRRNSGSSHAVYRNVDEQLARHLADMTGLRLTVEITA